MYKSQIGDEFSGSEWNTWKNIRILMEEENVKNELTLMEIAPKVIHDDIIFFESNKISPANTFCLYPINRNGVEVLRSHELQTRISELHIVAKMLKWLKFALPKNRDFDAFTKKLAKTNNNGLIRQLEATYFLGQLPGFQLIKIEDGKGQGKDAVFDFELIRYHFEIGKQNNYSTLIRCVKMAFNLGDKINQLRKDLDQAPCMVSLSKGVIPEVSEKKPLTNLKVNDILLGNSGSINSIEELCSSIVNQYEPIEDEELEKSVLNVSFEQGKKLYSLTMSFNLMQKKDDMYFGTCPGPNIDHLHKLNKTVDKNNEYINVFIVPNLSAIEQNVPRGIYLSIDRHMYKGLTFSAKYIDLSSLEIPKKEKIIVGII